MPICGCVNMVFFTASLAAYAQVSIPEPAVIIVGSDMHQDEDQAVGAYRPLRVFGDAWTTFGADAAIMLGDNNSRVLNIPAPGGGTCNTNVMFSSACPFPSLAAQTWYINDLATHAPDPTRIWSLPGNHDSHPILTAAGPPWNIPDGWWLETVNPLGQTGVVDPLTTQSTFSHYRVDVITGTNTWVLLFIGDENNHQDKSIGGRCSDELVDAWRCSTSANPVGAVDLVQYQWLEWQIGEAARWNASHADQHYVVIATHQPPPNTVVGSWEYEADDEVCPGVRMQTTSPHKRDAVYTPDRTDLDVAAPWDPAGRTPLQVADAWAGTLLRWDAGKAPNSQWAEELLLRFPNTVKLWLAGHNHLPTPDAQVNGHGTRADLVGTAVLAMGPLTRARCTTPGYCKSSAGLLSLMDNGDWSLIRENLDNTWVPGNCAGYTAAVKSVVPGPWLNIPIETN